MSNDNSCDFSSSEERKETANNLSMSKGGETFKMYYSEILMLLNCGAGEDFCESLGQQGDQTSQS